MLARADQKNSPRGNQSSAAAVNGCLNEHVPQRKQHACRRNVEYDDPAARIDDGGLRQKTDGQQADERHIPEFDRAAQVRPEGGKVRQRVFAPKHVEDHKNDGRERPHFEEGRNLAGVLIDQQVIAGSRQPCHGYDHGDIGQTNCAEEGGVRERFPPAQQLVCVRSGRQCVALVNIHGLPAARSRSRRQSVCVRARKRHNRQRST